MSKRELKRDRLVAALIIVAALTVPASASAQSVIAGRDSPPDVDDTKYVFPDDPLAAGFFGADDVHIQVWRTPKRTTLIRLRTQFVPEMLKSVEAL